MIPEGSKNPPHLMTPLKYSYNVQILKMTQLYTTSWNVAEREKYLDVCNNNVN
jgi:hypothetical protein